MARKISAEQVQRKAEQEQFIRQAAEELRWSPELLERIREDKTAFDVAAILQKNLDRIRELDAAALKVARSNTVIFENPESMREPGETRIDRAADMPEGRLERPGRYRDALTEDDLRPYSFSVPCNGLLDDDEPLPEEVE